VYTVYLYVENPEDVFSLRPDISVEIFKRWDMERSAQKLAQTQKEEIKKQEENNEKQRKTGS
jgi:hypothetical protein